MQFYEKTPKEIWKGIVLHWICNKFILKNLQLGWKSSVRKKKKSSQINAKFTINAGNLLFVYRQQEELLMLKFYRMRYCKISKIER